MVIMVLMVRGKRKEKKMVLIGFNGLMKKNDAIMV